MSREETETHENNCLQFHGLRIVINSSKSKAIGIQAKLSTVRV